MTGWPSTSDRPSLQMVPNVGLEPTTLRLRFSRNWVSYSNGGRSRWISLELDPDSAEAYVFEERWWNSEWQSPEFTVDFAHTYAYWPTLAECFPWCKWSFQTAVGRRVVQFDGEMPLGTRRSSVRRWLPCWTFFGHPALKKKARGFSSGFSGRRPVGKHCFLGIQMVSFVL